MEQSNPSDSNNPFLAYWEPIDYSRHRLPHWFQPKKFYFITWRTADSLPKEKLVQYEEQRRLWKQMHPQPWDLSVEQEYHKLFSSRIDKWLDHGTGECILQNAQFRSIVDDAILHFDHQRFELHALVVMPNHVHTLIRQKLPYTVGQLVKSWKGYTSREINKMLERRGEFWQEDYFDRLVRTPAHFDCCVRYIIDNPQKAHLSDGNYSLYLSEFVRNRLEALPVVVGGGLENPPSFPLPEQ